MPSSEEKCLRVRCGRVSRRLGRCERVGSPGGRVARKKLSPGGAAGGSGKGPPRFAEDNFADRGWHWPRLQPFFRPRSESENVQGMHCFSRPCTL